MAARRNPGRVLVVEDDKPVRELVRLILEADGHQVHVEKDGTRLAEAVESARPGIAILDVRLSCGPDGLTLARELRAIADIPILFLTGADSMQDRLRGFDSGGSDYVTKPFEPAELAARVRALLRLSGSRPQLRVGPLLIDESARTVDIRRSSLTLRRREFDLLATLARSPGVVLSKRQLLETVWGYEGYDDHLVEVHVHQIRRKLKAHDCDLLETVRGVGYVLRSPVDSGAPSAER